MCRSSGKLLVVESAERATFYSLDCNQWSCWDCNKTLARQHKYRMIKALGSGKTWHFVTLTAHENCKNEHQSILNLSQGFRKLMERLRRRNGTRRYVVVHEHHKRNGRVHAHLLYESDKLFRIGERLKDHARECGMGYMVDEQVVGDDFQSVARYLAKYLSKSINAKFPRNFRRIRYSAYFDDFNEKSEFLSDSEAYVITASKEVLEFNVRYYERLKYIVRILLDLAQLP